MKKRMILISAMILAFSLSAVEAPLPVTLNDEQYIEAENITDQACYLTSTTVGDDVEFKLGEDLSRNERWQVISYDPAQCRIKIDHEKKGFWPFTKEYAEIEIKALKRGKQTIILQCGGKRISISFNAI